jgi:tRNA A37 N6-isopentenylltransferase MiaA
MLTTLLVLVLSVAPCTPQETTAACKCKQGSATACEALRQTDPKLAAKLEKEAAQRAQQATKPVVPTGQQHHIISKTIANELKQHGTLKGLYQPRDPRFVSQAVDKAAHNGYQHWHRQIDAEVVQWLKANKAATPKQFEDLLRSIYSRPEMLARFPNGF